MFEGKTIAVTVPCYNEETKIINMLETIPDYVDTIYLVDDCSTDNTQALVNEYVSTHDKVLLTIHEVNRGVGAAIATGYQQALKDNVDIVVVMAGDGQMNADDLPRLIAPIVTNKADYVKGNRFFYSNSLHTIPKVRLFGNLMLSALTKIVSGYWHTSDSQCGYTAISQFALKRIDLSAIYPRYGCPNDILTKLNIAEIRVAEVSVCPIYGKDWASKMKVPKVIWPMLKLLIRLFFQRVYYKYICLNGHPLVFYFVTGAFTVSLSGILLLYILIKTLALGLVPKAALILLGISLTISVQLILSAFSMDYDANKHLCVRYYD